nr:MAG TPA: hypothetical protein [Caudoviricetes sp.]
MSQMFSILSTLKNKFFKNFLNHSNRSFLSML